METTDAFSGLSCRDCGEGLAPEAAWGRCPECGGALEPAYGDESIDASSVDAADGRESMWAYDSLLPVPRSDAVTMAEGDTPAVSCPDLASEIGVDRLVVKDEGRNPTGSVRDRELSVAVTLARAAGAGTVALPSTGDAAQSAAAYAARAGLSVEAFLPSRANFAAKAMVNVHGGEMSVVEGRYGDAAAFADATDGEDWRSVAPFGTPYRVEGAKTLWFELVDDLGDAPDAVVVPTAHGLTLLGMYRGARTLDRLGVIEGVPSLYAAQPSGCAPIVTAFESGDTDVAAIEHPDTICGALEVPDPTAGAWVLEAIEASGGGAIAVDDDALLEAATGTAARAGLEPGVACGSAVAGAEQLADGGEIDRDDAVVVVNTATGNKEADVLRSHLMSKGI